MTRRVERAFRMRWAFAHWSIQHRRRRRVGRAISCGGLCGGGCRSPGWVCELDGLGVFCWLWCAGCVVELVCPVLCVVVVGQRWWVMGGTGSRGVYFSWVSGVLVVQALKALR